MTIIETPKGRIRVIPPSVDLLRHLRDLLPFGMAQFREPMPDGARYGIVMQSDDHEVCCIKQQPKELDLEGAKRWMEIQHWMCAEAYGRYVREGFHGAYLAGVYLRQRDNGLWEPGVAHFVFPSADGMEAEDSAWAMLAAQGVEEVVHLPAVPMAIKAGDLAVTKGALHARADS